MLKIISSAIDTIELSIRINVRLEVISRVADAKRAAKDAGEKAELVLGGHRFLVPAHGAGMYLYLLNNKDFDIKISPSKMIPAVAVRIRSIYLHEVGAEHAARIILDFAKSIREEPEIEFDPYLRLKRLDICVDFQGWEPNLEDFHNFSCRAKKRGVYFEGDIPNYYRFGEKNMLVRIYNKTEELKVSNKSWMNEVWQISNEFDDQIPVWRLEVQLRRDALKSLMVLSIDDALKNLGGIWRYAMEWLELKQASSNKQKSRRPLDPRWQHLKNSVSFRKNACKKVRYSKRKAEEVRLVRAGGGYLTSLAALYGDYDIRNALLRFGIQYQKYLAGRGVDFITIVQGKIDKQEEDVPF